MPTGYTAEIAEGQEFTDFVLGCARAFGACLHQRDDKMSDKPRKLEEQSYHDERLEEARTEFLKFNLMTPQERDQYGVDEQKREIERCQKRFNEKILLKTKYDEMIAKVSTWQPPSQDHTNLKQFMLDQLNDSVTHDCNTKYDLEELHKASTSKPRDFYNRKVNSIQWDINYHTEQGQKEKERKNGSNLWIEQLYTSLGVEYQ